MSDTGLATINARLQRRFGMSQLDDTRVRFHVKPIHGYTERRFGVFEGHTASGIYIGTETGWKELLKYREFVDSGKFVLEELFANHHHDLEGKTRYEPLWIFPKDKPLVYKAVEFLIEIRLGIRTDPDKPKNEADIQALIEKRLKAEKEYAFEALGGKAGIADQLHYGSGVFISSKRF